MLANWLLLLAAVQSALALQCDKSPLNHYRLGDSPLFQQSTLRDTPPSKTNTTWYFNLCQAEADLPAECPKNAQICGVQTVLLAGQEPVVSQVISWGQGLNYFVGPGVDDGLLITMDTNSWGSNSVDAVLNLECTKDEDISVKWDQSTLNVTWSSPYACLRDSEAPPPDKPKDGHKGEEKPSDDSWGWFTWLFIILVLGFGAYIIMGAWLTYTKSPADMTDAVHDFVDTLKGLVQGVPGFIGEIFSRVMGRTDRGGYSAV